MSHSHERTEKVCLNCQAALYGRYCHNCGQENINPRESFWSLLTHFFNDITHFDGKFFTTLSNLVRKPGFLPAEYSMGHRARYLHPIRMYLFTSFIFFLVFYSYASHTNLVVSTGNQIASDTTNRVSADSVSFRLFGREYSRTSTNDLANNKMLIQNFIHSFPTLLFISLPLFALFLKILYLRHKNYVYADHAIFLVYLYIFTFILGLILIGVDKFADLLHASWISWLLYAFLIYGAVYTFIAMKRFYQQGAAKTTLKFVLFNLTMFFTLAILSILSLIFTIFRS